MSNKAIDKKYARYYNEEKFFGKLKKLLGKLGEEIALRLLMLYFLMQSKKVPLKVRMLIVAALGYFILPADLVSDFIPAFGFTDDIAFLTYTFNQASKYADDTIKKKASEKLKSWFSSQGKSQNNSSATMGEDFSILS